nr:hypothetical protein [Tanacetum cinerariifolium]
MAILAGYHHRHAATTSPPSLFRHSQPTPAIVTTTASSLPSPSSTTARVRLGSGAFVWFSSDLGAFGFLKLGSVWLSIRIGVLCFYELTSVRAFGCGYNSKGVLDPGLAAIKGCLVWTESD